MLSNCVLDIIIFTVQTNSIYNVPEIQLTIAAYLHLIQFRFSHNQSYYRTKLRMFHFIMMIRFISHITKVYIWKWFTILLYWPTIVVLGILHPCLPLMNGTLYWLSIFLSCVSLLVVESTTLFVP